MSTRPRRALVGAGLVVLVAGVALVLVAVDDAEPAETPASLSEALVHTTEAGAPFPGLTETQVVVGDDELRVILADDADERYQGLRARETLGAYDGMLFVYEEPVESKYTMSTVPVPLDIAFYDGEGRVVSRRRMTPCAGTESECPLYEADGPFVFALETLAGNLPTGPLR